MYKAIIVYNDNVKEKITFNTEKKIIYEDENYFYLGDKKPQKFLKEIVRFIMVEEIKK